MPPDSNSQPHMSVAVSASDQPIRQKSRWLIVGVSVLLLVALATYFAWDAQFPPQLGFNTKTVWDVLDLLVVPLALAGGAAYLNKMQKDSEDRIAQSRQAEEANLGVQR